MTDVVRLIKPGATPTNNSAVTGVTQTGQYKTHRPALHNNIVEISGVNGVTRNCYLDDRYDNKDYYTA